MDQPPHIVRAATFLPMTGVGVTADYYRTVLGFRREYEAGAPPVVYPPALQPYGVREFAIRDCDGHVLGFGQAHAGAS